MNGMVRGLLLASLVAIAMTSATATAQICQTPLPPSFSGLNGSGTPTPDNQAILNVFTSTDSTDPIQGDNVAVASLAENISIAFDDARVAAGQPFTLAASVGIQPLGIASPLIDGLVWLGPQSFPLLDGLGFFGPANIFASTAGPNGVFQVFANTGLNPANVGLCMTLQTLVFDPIAPGPFFLAFSNPVAFGIAAGIASINPNIAPVGGSMTLQAPGANPGGGDVLTFPGGQTATTGIGGNFAVPGGAVSGNLSLSLGGTSAPSTITPDSIQDFAVVTATAVTTMTGNLTMVPDPTQAIPGTRRGTGLGNILIPGGADVWTLPLIAGDIIEVEVYSTDASFTHTLDGRGSAVNPFVQEGFDPFVQIEQSTNGGDTLLFDATFAPVGPFALHFDDDDGPENNSRLVWQAKYADVYRIFVGDVNPVAFVTGSYVVNVRVIPGAPCITGFVSGTTRSNIVPQGSTLTCLGANLIPGNTYTVSMIPLAGAPFSTRTIPSVLCITGGRLSFLVPAALPGELPMGLHQVQLFDEVNLVSGLVWDNTRVNQPVGPLPDIVCIRGATRTQATTATIVNGAHPITALNTQSYLFGGATAANTNLNAGFTSFTVPANAQVVYIEALGVADIFNDRFDSHFGFSGANTFGIYNPFIRLFQPGFATGPDNDDDGIFPAPLFPFPMGIGASAALIDTQGPAFNPAGGAYNVLLQENVIFGTGTAAQISQSHLCLVNVVVL
jgi:hypothetical protein